MDFLVPWLNAHWQKLTQRYLDGRLPHALLLHGPQGIGIDRFAAQFAAFLGCQNLSEQNMPCGDCQSCRTFAQSAHPDMKLLQVAADKKQISVQQIRDMQEFMILKPNGDRPKVVVICPIDAMNQYAANGLLKILEEPPGHAVFILVSHRLHRVIPTIRSRCQQIAFYQPSDADALQWLQQQDVRQPEILLEGVQGLPCLAVELMDEPWLSHKSDIFMTIVAGITRNPRLLRANDKKMWSKVPPEWLIQWVQSLLRDLIRQAKSLSTSHFENKNFMQQLSNQSLELNLEHLFRVQDALNSVQRQSALPLNQDLLVERIAGICRVD